MENNKISYATLKKVLTPKEMKNVTGGSSCICRLYIVHISR